MKKLLFLSIILSVLLVLGACNKDSGSVSKEPVSKGKDSELVIEVDGKEKTIPARVEENIGFTKEIKIPEKANIVVDKYEKAVIVTYGNQKFMVNDRETSELMTPELELKDYKEEAKLSEPSGDVPVTEIDLNKYPSLKDKYDWMLVVDGTKEKEFYLVKYYEKDKAKRMVTVRFFIPSSEYNEEALLQMISILDSVKY